MIKFGQVKVYDPAAQTALIEYVRPDACAKCKACGVLNQSGSIRLKAECREGDWVRIAFPDEKFVSAAATAYVVPLVGFLAGLTGGYLLSGKNELWALGGSLVGLGICMLVLKLNEKRISAKPEWTPHVEAVYSSKPDMDEIGCGGEKL